MGNASQPCKTYVFRLLSRGAAAVICLGILIYGLVAYHRAILIEGVSPGELTDHACAEEHQSFREPIPRRLHQTWKSRTIPKRWRPNQAHCIKMSPDYKYTLWTDEDIEDFLTKHYAWFLATYTNYTYPIQRVDAARYFILYHYGGVYLDIDIDCLVPLDKVLSKAEDADVVMAATAPLGVTNNFMASKTGNPFMKLLTRSLVIPQTSHWSPHVTVMTSAGPLFVYSAYADYPCKQDIHILSVDQHREFFRHEQAGTWHSWDAPLISWLDRNQQVLIPLLILILCLLSGATLYAFFCRTYQPSAEFAR